MQNPIVAITDKVMRMLKAMVYLAMRVGCRRGATVPDITSFLENWAPSERNLYHTGVVERVLFDLQNDGKVTHAGARWYVVGAPA
ncbi:MAG: hypothetical protein V7746_26470 [Halioglobus sp.]